MKKKPEDSGKPTCCAPGDLSACMIETADETDKTHSEANLSKESLVTDESKKREKAQPAADHKSN